MFRGCTSTTRISDDAISTALLKLKFKKKYIYLGSQSYKYSANQFFSRLRCNLTFFARILFQGPGIWPIAWQNLSVSSFFGNSEHNQSSKGKQQ